MPEETANPLLEQLRDIHVPAELGWWPPAIGWWVLALIMGFIIYKLARHLIQRQRLNYYKKQALMELSQQFDQWQQNDNDTQYLQGTHALLGRICLHLENGRPLSTLTGQQWIDELNRYSAQQLDQESAVALTQATYRKEPAVDVQALHKNVGHWIKHHKRAPLNSPIEKAKSNPSQVSEEPNHA